MGARANYVIVDGGRWELFYSHWGAQNLELDILAGPGAATRFIRDQRAIEPAGWLDDVWCEGAALVDHDQRQLRLFTWHLEDYGYRAAVLRVLAETWPGWTVAWAYDGLADLTDHVGLPRAVVRADSTPDPPYPVEDPAETDCLITITNGDTTRGYAVEVSTASDIIDHGPPILDILPAEAEITHCPVTPESGVHLDTGTRTAGAWTALTLGGALERAPRLWPGWRWEFWHDNYDQQLTRARGAVHVPAPDISGWLVTLARLFVRHPEQHPAQTAQELIDHLTEAGHHVTPGASLYDHHTATVFPAEREAVTAAIRTVTARG